MVDLIKCLNEYGANVDIFDPWVDSHEVLQEFDITVNNDLTDINRNKYDTVVYAVAHRGFMSLMPNEFKKSVIIDVKGIVDNSHWNL